jgi:hypothetical protein
MIRRSHAKFDQTYVLCPTYEIPNTIPDYQACVSGSPLTDENFIDTCNRELGEELGLQIVNKNVNIIERSSDLYQYKHSFININNTVQITNPNQEKTNDTDAFRMSLILYGNLKSFNSYCTSKVTRLHDPKEHKALTMACLIPLSYLHQQITTEFRRRMLLKKDRDKKSR